MGGQSWLVVRRTGLTTSKPIWLCLKKGLGTRDEYGNNGVIMGWSVFRGQGVMLRNVHGVKVVNGSIQMVGIAEMLGSPISKGTAG